LLIFPERGIISMAPKALGFPLSNCSRFSDEKNNCNLLGLNCPP